MLNKLLSGTVFFFISICCYGQGIPDISERKRLHIQKINHPDTVFDLQRLPVCSNYGCKKITYVKFGASQWQNILSFFSTSINSAETEREQLKYVIAYIESIVGEQTNTQHDLGGTFSIYLNLRNGKSEQMDCIDESSNTLLYLRLLEQKQKIIWHDVVGLTTRGGIFAGYPHTAVLLQEKKNNEKYIIDSWFHKNGHPAEVVRYKKWKRGWKPNK